MKKIIALMLSLVLVFACSISAFAAKSPVAEKKHTVTVRKALGVVPIEKSDIEYTVNDGTVITVKADEAKYGKFDSWSVYKVVATVEGVSAPVKSGVMTLNAAINLAATVKTEPAKVDVDYTVVSGSLTSKELTIKVNSDIIVCGNYAGTTTDPLVNSNADNSASAPQTGDMTVIYVAVVMLAALAFGFSAKKVYSK